MSFLLAARVAGLAGTSPRAIRAPEVAAQEASAGVSGDAPAAALPIRWTPDPVNPARTKVAGDVIRRLDNLRPAEETFESFLHWWVGKAGPGPMEDTEELLAQWTWLNERRVWARVDPVETAPAPSEPPVAEAPEPEPDKPAVTAAEPEPASPPVVTPERGLAAPLAEDHPKIAPGRRKLRPAEAATRFVEWVQICGRAGKFNDRQLAELYREHCKAEDLIALPENFLRRELLKLPEVTRRQETDYVLAKGGIRDRKRNRMWTIAAGAPTTVVEPQPDDETVVPFDLPMRRVA